MCACVGAGRFISSQHIRRGFLMQPVSVAVSDSDSDRRTSYEHALRGEPGVALLTNGVSSNGVMLAGRRAKSRARTSVTENEVARAKRLKPCVLLVDSNLCASENFSMLASLRRECPETFVVLLVDDSWISEDMIIQAMGAGVRGYLRHEDAQRYLSRVAQVVERGEIWVSRKMLGKIMNRVLNHEV